MGIASLHPSYDLVLLSFIPWSVSAQTVQDDRLRQVVADLKACVRTQAPTARTSGVQTSDDAINFLFKACAPPLSDLAPEKVGVIPPGLLRIAIRDEWNTFMEHTRPR